MRKSRSVEKIVINSALIIYALITLIPVLIMLRTSLAPTLFYTTFELNTGFTLDHYKEVFLNSEFPRYVANSIIVATLSTAAVMLIGSMAGYALARFRFRFRESFLFFVLTTRMGPPVAFALPLFLLIFSIGQLDTYPALIAVYILYSLAFAVWMTQGFFAEVPREVEEAGFIDGLSRIGVWIRISCPLALPGLVATAIFVFITTWNEFFFAFVLTRTTAKTWPTHMSAFAGSFQIAWGEIFAASLIAMLPAIIFGILIRSFLPRGLSLGAVR